MNHSANQIGPHQRRRFLQLLAAGSTLAIPGWALGKNSLWLPDDLPMTPEQTEGPFYPETTIEQQLFNDNDLTRKLGDHELAKGQLIEVQGVVRDRKGQPLKGAVLEIWQACSSGRYSHSRDTKNPGLVDNNFQFWGRAVTRDEGAYSFKTIVPGMYPGRSARHIHYRIDADGCQRLTTQCYFSEFGKDNERDNLYAQLNREERKLVTVEIDKPVDSPNEQKPGEGKLETLKPWTGSFNIVMARK